MAESPLAAWATRPDCVIICGGKGTRLNPHMSHLAKSMVPVGGQPILDHVIDSWRPVAGRFVFVLNYLAQQIASHVETLGIEHSIYLEQGKGRGIANALLSAAGEVRSERFVMVLGDCLHRGRWTVPAQMVQGVGVIATDNPEDIQSSYSVEHDEQSLIQRVVEKPRHLPNDLCGTGFYFFSQTVFEAIPRTPPSPLKGQVEITDVLQQMVDEGHPLYAARLEGQYLNVTRPGDLARAEAIVG